MKSLKIDNGKCLYNIGEGYKTILDITKEDILKMLEYVYDNSECEFDEYSEEDIVNEAEKVIYDNLYKKIIDFQNKKAALKSEIDLIFSKLEEKYN